MPSHITAPSDTPSVPPPASPSFGSVCSGIESTSVAWTPLGMRPAWFSEIDPFANSLLNWRYPNVQNIGDMRSIAVRILMGDIEAPDVLAGGTPCQSFSLAGVRKGLADQRGALTLSYVEIANAIDNARLQAHKQPCIAVWENVPGVLTSRDNAFGHFLAGLAGERQALQPPGRRWTNTGCVFGPQRTAAWRVLDAQYFGLAQRRKRVFLVASARTDVDPTEILFEREGVRRDTAPSRSAWQVAPTLSARCTAGGGLGTDFECDGGLIAVFGGNRTGGNIEISPALLSHAGSTRQDFESEAFIARRCISTWQQVAHTLRGEGFDAGEDGRGRGTPLVPVCMAFDPTQITSRGNVSQPRVGDPSHPLLAGARAPHVILSGASSELDRACNRLWLSHISVRRLTPRECERLQGLPDDYTLIPHGSASKRTHKDAQWLHYVLQGQDVSSFDQARLAADGPRYRSIGNAIAVPCLSWIGHRLLKAIA
jgi:DNA (cytosine-5)-methyltransferase 1